MDNTCIFCALPLDGSDEHIIPESLNGRLHTKELICKACNNKFGTSLDPFLKSALHTTMHVVGVGKAETIKVEDEAGRRYLAKRDGKIKPENIDVHTFTKDERVGIQVSGVNEKEVAKAFAKKLIRVFGPQKALIVAKQPGIKISTSQLVPSNLSARDSLKISNGLLLALEKIICEFYAHRQLDLSLIQGRLKKIHELNDAVADVLIVNKDQKMRKPETLEISHLIVIRSEHEQIYAYLELFNVLCCYVVLASNYSGPAINEVYYQDAIAGKVIEKEINIDISAVHSTETSFELLQNSLFARLRDIELSDYIGEYSISVKNHLDQQLNAGEITKEEYRELLAQNIAYEIARLMVDLPHYFEFEEEDEVLLNIHKVNYIHSLVNEEHKDKFEQFYHQLIGGKITVAEENIQYVIIGFHYTKAIPTNKKQFLKAYFHIRSEDNSKEKHVLAKVLFDGIGLPPPPEDSLWLLDL